jgi:Uma2 family endonuclease
MTLTAEKIKNKQFTADELLRMPDRNGYELMGGQLKEKPVSRESSRIGATVARLLGVEANRTGEAEVYGADLGYNCFGDAEKEIRKADASVIRKQRLAEIGDVGYMPIPADLAVEVLSPNDLAREVNEKIEDYLNAGFVLIWIVDPDTKTVMIHRRDGSVTRLHENDEITGETALPSFRCRVAELLD